MINRRFENLEGEIWVSLLRDYEISNMGRVVSLKGTFPRIMRTYPNNKLAGYFNISRGTANNIHRRKTWIHVN